MLKNLLPFLLIAAGLAACDQVKEPIPPSTPGGPDGGEFVKRRLLLEDFTGHRCNNCPAAANTAQQLQALYGEDLVVVGVHVTETFAAPLSNGTYTTDFRTPAGDAYEQAFGISWLPAGMVSRHTFDNGKLLAHTGWSAAVAELIGSEADLDIWFEELEHDAANNTVSAVVKVAVLQPITGTHNLTIYLTEDHVIDWQTNAAVSPPDVPDYDHRHVLRTNINGTWGEEVIATSANAGDTLTLSYSDHAMDPAWVAGNCALVAYVYSTTTDEVLQVAEKKFTP